MSYLHQLKPQPHARKKQKRVGRGQGSGTGKTSGRGHKGQKQHNKAPRPGFEGGQMPIIRTIPKRGFRPDPANRYQILNISELADVDTEQTVSVEWLFKNRYIREKRVRVKILGTGEIKKALHVQAHAFSKSAAEKIEKAGGKCETLGKK